MTFHPQQKKKFSIQMADPFIMYEKYPYFITWNTMFYLVSKFLRLVLTIDRVFVSTEHKYEKYALAYWCFQCWTLDRWWWPLTSTPNNNVCLCNMGQLYTKHENSLSLQYLKCINQLSVINIHLHTPSIPTSYKCPSFSIYQKKNK